jgi:hypothetical protein
MKKIIIISILLFSGVTANSQILISLLLGDKLNSDGLEFGLEGGANWSTISGFESSKYMRSFNLGFYFDIRLKNQWSLYTGTLMKAKIGIDELTATDLIFFNTTTYPPIGEYKQTINTFLIPVLLKYKLKNHFYLEAGSQFGLIYGAWIEYNSNINNVNARVRETNKDQFNRIDAGFMGGFGYQLMKGKGMTVGVKYYTGFIDVYKEKAGTKNSSIFIKVNIPIGANKKKEEEL